MKKIILFIFVSSGIIFSQQPSRNSDLFRNNPRYNYFSISRFMSVIAMTTLDDWETPASIYSIDNIPFDIIPFDFFSPDLIPIDLLQSEVESSYSKVSKYSNYALGNVNFARKEIADSTELRIRGFLGSVTGDPLIFSFSRNEEENYNRNKIVPSGVVSYSSNYNKLKWRLTGGYFGFFITGSEGDKKISSLDGYYFKKQNKQVILSAEANYKMRNDRSIDFLSSFISFYGWDMPPFLGSMNHIESYLNTTRFTFKNFLRGFNFTLLRDQSIGQINKNVYTDAMKFKISKYSVLPVYSFNLGKTKFNSSVNFSLYNFKNMKSNKFDTYQKYFAEETSKLYFFLSQEIFAPLTKTHNAGLKISLERNIVEEENISLSVYMEENIGESQKAIFKISSVVNSPTVNQLYGSFKTTRNLYNEPHQFAVRGNSELKSERINRVEAGYLLWKNDFFKSRFTGSFQFIKNPIEVNTEVTKETTGFVQRNYFTNEDDFSSYGLDVFFFFQPINFLNLKLNYHYESAEEYSDLRVSQLLISSDLQVVKNGFFNFEFFRHEGNKSRHYTPEIFDDYISTHSVSPGSVEGYSIFSIGYTQSLLDFYFFDKLKLGVEIENIFNTKVQYFPVGVYIDRTIIFTMNTEI